MEPSATPPWRVLDAPTAGGGASGEPPSESSRQMLLTPTILKVAATAGGAVVCAILAFVLAFAGGPGEPIAVDGGSTLPVVGASDGDIGSGAIDGAAGRAVIVEVVGAVLRPGVFRMPAGSRIGDVIEAAGGYGPRVDTTRAEQELNLAATLSDGDHVRVPSRDDTHAGASALAGAGGPSGVGGSGASGPVDINTATQAQLEDLPGIGPATAQKIIAAREEAPFAAVEELRTRGVLGEKTFAKLRELVAVR
jgi:competence protein ComEA